jgi:hypothetical protein
MLVSSIESNNFAQLFDSILEFYEFILNLALKL